MNIYEAKGVPPGEDDRLVEAMLAGADGDLLVSLTEAIKAQKDCSDAQLDAILLAADRDLLARLYQCAEPGDGVIFGPVAAYPREAS